jgi:hypothetical protein
MDTSNLYNGTYDSEYSKAQARRQGDLLSPSDFDFPDKIARNE